MAGIIAKEPTADDFFPCAATIDFSGTKFRCEKGSGHESPGHVVECHNFPVNAPATESYRIVITWYKEQR